MPCLITSAGLGLGVLEAAHTQGVETIEGIARLLVKLMKCFVTPIEAPDLSTNPRSKLGF